MHSKPQQEAHKLKCRKGQAAMEFLLTYGWAIILVLVVFAALVYFGVLSPKKLLPGKCLFQIGVQCEDYSASSESLISTPIPDSEGIEHYIRPVTFNLINRLGKTVYIVGLGVEGETRNYECAEFKLDCAEGTDVYQKYLDKEAWYFEPGKMCISLRKICNKADMDRDGIFEEGYNFNKVCDPERVLVWEPDSKLKAMLGQLFNLPSLDYANFYCLNLPDKGERINAQIVVTYHFGDPSLTHTAYGELSATVA